jgi:hypothetical protein
MADRMKRSPIPKAAIKIAARISSPPEPRSGPADPFKNLQAAARRRGLSLSKPTKSTDGKYPLYKGDLARSGRDAPGFGPNKDQRGMFCKNLREVREEFARRDALKMLANIKPRGRDLEKLIDEVEAASHPRAKYWADLARGKTKLGRAAS